MHFSCISVCFRMFKFNEQNLKRNFKQLRGVYKYINYYSHEETEIETKRLGSRFVE